jgi:hypothetical protein
MLSFFSFSFSVSPAFLTYSLQFRELAILYTRYTSFCIWLVQFLNPSFRYQVQFLENFK